MRLPALCRRASIACIAMLGGLSNIALATQDAAAPTSQPSEVKQMSLDELLDTEVTLVSRRPEKVAETASAIQVITGEEIRRSGALTLPEALRLAPNLQVAQQTAHDWAITARGFNGAPLSNNSLADKLLVMIDGRSVYTPLFGGVFWDVQNVLLEDVDRIEVVSGPGGTLWGANAVNGVINIVTKSARDTQGLYLTSAAGSTFDNYDAFRYGGAIGTNFFYRVYGFGFEHGPTYTATGASADDDWQAEQGGMRMDYYPSDADTFTLQSDMYGVREGDPNIPAASGGGPLDVNAEGTNVLSRWTHVFSPSSDLIVQAYFDGTWRHLPDTDFGYAITTYDLDVQHRFALNDRNSILWGGGYRITRDRIRNAPTVSILPEKRTTQLFNVFLQDEIQLVPDRLKLTVGSKLEHNDFSGFEVQPSVRLAWTPAERQTVWGAVSRAVRSPARFDSDISTPGIAKRDDFDSEKVTAFELGYRVRPVDPLSISIASFFNRYTELRSINFASDPPPPITFGNDQRGDTWGVELSADLQATSWWRLRGGYTFLDNNIHADSATVVPGDDTFETNDPHNQIVVQSMMELPKNVEFDLVGRYVDSLPRDVPSYFSLDARLAWQYRNWEFSVVGQNLLDDRHPEFGALEIERSVYGKVSLRW